MKPLRFIGSSRDELGDSPSEARRDAGFERYAQKTRKADIDLATRRYQQIAR